MADPPWAFRDRGTPNRRLSRFYETMTLDEICQLPVERFALLDCVLLLCPPSHAIGN